MIAANLDIRGHEVLNGWIGATKHDVFGCCFYVVVDDVIRPGTVPSTDCLFVGGDGVNVGDVGINYRRFRTVQADAALKLLTFESVDPQSIEDQMMRDACKIS